MLFESKIQFDTIRKILEQSARIIRPIEDANPYSLNDRSNQGQARPGESERPLFMFALVGTEDKRV